MTLEAFVKKTGQTLKENSPAILTALGIAGVASTGYLTARAAYRTGQFVVLENQTRAGTDEAELTAKEIVAVSWRSFTPGIGAGLIAATCILAAHTVSTRRNAALVSALTLGESAFREYREKMVEVAGKTKDQKAIDELAQEKIERTPNSEIIVLGDGEETFFDDLTGRYFKSSKAAIERAEIDFNRQIMNDMYASQNEWYDKLGLGRVATGDDIGWNNDYPLEIRFSALFKDDKPVGVISYRFRPIPNFHRTNY